LEPFGDRALRACPSAKPGVEALWAKVKASPPPGAEEVVAGDTTLMVVFDSAVARDQALDWPGWQDLVASAPPPAHELEVRVCYDGADLDEVAERLGLSTKQVVSAHGGTTYRVGFLGFSPGFAYLRGLPAPLELDRRALPRRMVPAGSVAIAGSYSAIYPQTTPGGWLILGRTDMAMFDPYLEQPCALMPGDRVSFVPVDEVGPVPALTPPAYDLAGKPWVKVADPGPFSTVQDCGRRGWAHLGVPAAGPADVASARAANFAVGNPPGAALIESTLAGPRLILGAARSVAVTGAHATVTVDGLPARRCTALPLPAGAEIEVHPYQEGARVYVAIEGGIDAPVVLGSRSCDTLGGLGPPPLRSGDVLPLGDPSRWGVGEPPAEPTEPPPPSEPLLVEAQSSWGADLVGSKAMEILAGMLFKVSQSSNRVGVRLESPEGSQLASLLGPETARITSEGLIPGAVQLTPAGVCVVMGRNHPTTGGYPVVVTISEADLDLLAQALPGQHVRLALG